MKEELVSFILGKFTHEPTIEQLQVVRRWADFLFSPDSDDIFMLQGYAGTGKTSLVGALVRALVALRRPVVLLAPTGRAAKVFSLHSDHVAYTIHKKIYRQRVFSVEMTGFQSGHNNHEDTLFIVDEASMIANEGFSGSGFGSGHLLDDLIHYVYAGRGCRLMLVGDSAQLPPVGEELSPALSQLALEGYGLNVYSEQLTQVVRQVEKSGILWNATMLHKLISSDEIGAFPRLKISGFPDVRVVPGDEIVDLLEDSFYKCGHDQTIVVTRSNRHANIYNNGIRSRILMYDSEIVSGDRLIVVRNNYYWINEKPQTGEESVSIPLEGQACGASFIANGDVCVVQRIRNQRELYGFLFADATLTFPDFDDMEITATILLDTLQSESPALTRDQQNQLFNSVCADYPDIHDHRKLMEQIRKDPYFNALQVKYAYAVTCHKAQGGQWQRVFVDQGYVTSDMLSPDYFRWLYTAITRATETVYLINWPQAQIYI